MDRFRVDVITLLPTSHYSHHAHDVFSCVFKLGSGLSLVEFEHSEIMSCYMLLACCLFACWLVTCFVGSRFLSWGQSVPNVRHP